MGPLLVAIVVVVRSFWSIEARSHQPAVRFLENLAALCFVEAQQPVEFVPPVKVIPLEATISFSTHFQPTAYKPDVRYIALYIELDRQIDFYVDRDTDVCIECIP